MQRLIRIDGHPIGITEMEYRVLELLAFARNNVVTRQMLLKHLYRRADDQPQPKIIDVFISKLRKKLRNASGGAEFIETIRSGWIPRDIDGRRAGLSPLHFLDHGRCAPCFKSSRSPASRHRHAWPVAALAGLQRALKLVERAGHSSRTTEESKIDLPAAGLGAASPVRNA